MKNIFVSFVVDKLASHYYQAELLLYSLERFSKISKKNIVVQCVIGVEQIFLEYLKEHDYKYNFIEPFLDKKYCNKLQQLEYFKSIQCDGVILLDTDMFILNTLSIKDNIFQAKIVDAPNPSLNTLQNIYDKASLTLPSIVNTDWKMDAKTISNNFNGGFYYIPSHNIEKIDYNWKKWATWLFYNQNLFLHEREKNHIDQISIGMALHENNIKFKYLSANYNYPTHQEGDINSFNSADSIKNLHYHWLINDYGYLETPVKMQPILDAILKVNDAIAEKKKFIFFYNFLKTTKYSPTNIAINSSEKINKFKQNIKDLTNNKKLELIIHAGTPKTATTSLQFYCDSSQDELLEKGILYPQIYLDTPEPKHQWLVGMLKAENLDGLYNYIEQVYNKAILVDAKSILLSTEGIYNHWWDYSNISKEALHILSLYFSTKLWIVFREPVSFMDSLYKQYLKNPRILGIDCYGKDLTFEEMFKDKWFKEHLNYLGFLVESESIFGIKNTKVFAYSKNVMKEIQKELGLDIHSESYNKNKAQSTVVVELLCNINRYNLSIEDKEKAVQSLYVLDEIMTKYSPEKNFATILETKINKKMSLQKEAIKLRYGIDIY